MARPAHADRALFGISASLAAVSNGSRRRPVSGRRMWKCYGIQGTQRRRGGGKAAIRPRRPLFREKRVLHWHSPIPGHSQQTRVQLVSWEWGRGSSSPPLGQIWTVTGWARAGTRTGKLATWWEARFRMLPASAPPARVEYAILQKGRSKNCRCR